MRESGRPRPLRALAVGCGYALADRALLLLVSWATLPLPPAGQLQRGPFDLWAQWAQWDGRWYASIATGGYGPDPRRFAFFPLLPLLEAWLRGFLGGRADAAGVVISLVASCAAFALLYGRVSVWCDEATAERAVRYLALFPTGFFLAVAYTESLFLALALGCMWAVDRRRWLAAGAVGGCAALARNAGVLLALPLAWALWQARMPLRRWWPLALIPAGLAAFMAYQAAVTGDPLAFIHVQAVWSRHLMWPWATAAMLWNALRHAPDPAGNVANLAAAVLSAGTLALGLGDLGDLGCGAGAAARPGPAEHGPLRTGHLPAVCRAGEAGRAGAAPGPRPDAGHAGGAGRPVRPVHPPLFRRVARRVLSRRRAADCPRRPASPPSPPPPPRSAGPRS
jgi:hypothetical protein